MKMVTLKEAQDNIRKNWAKDIEARKTNVHDKMLKKSSSSSSNQSLIDFAKSVAVPIAVSNSQGNLKKTSAFKQATPSMVSYLKDRATPIVSSTEITEVLKAENPIVQIGSRSVKGGESIQIGYTTPTASTQSYVEKITDKISSPITGVMDTSKTLLIGMGILALILASKN